MKFRKPTLLVDKAKVLRNIKRVIDKANKAETAVWPHFKTHQSHEIGKWFNAYGINGITVSSVSMAEYFARAGWNEIYIAFPFNVNEIEAITELAATVNLTLLVNDSVHVTALTKYLSTPVRLKIEIETGANRSGLNPENIELIGSIIDQINQSSHVFDGFYSHFGHTYKAHDRPEVIDIYTRSLSILESLQKEFSFSNPQISLGDTPSASVIDNLDNIASLHAGNYVFYDLTQAQIGVCAEEDVAIVLATPVVSKNPERLELVVYGGGIHLSKEQLFSSEFGFKIFGKLVALAENGWSNSLEGCYVSSISQEHGVIKVTKEVFDQYNIGDTIGILPVHSCMTADCMATYYTLMGERLDHFQGYHKEKFT